MITRRKFFALAVGGATAVAIPVLAAKSGVCRATLPTLPTFPHQETHLRMMGSVTGRWSSKRRISFTPVRASASLQNQPRGG